MFLRRIFNKIATLKHNCHRTVLSDGVRKDVLWWWQCLKIFNGRSTLLDKKPIECVFTDACDDAAGGSFGRDWFYFHWSMWENKHIIIYSDNTTTVAAINKASSRNRHIMKCLRSLFWLSAFYNFHLTARYLQGTLNIVVDSASRLHLPGYLQTLLPFSNGTPLTYHMSSNFYISAWQVLILIFAMGRSQPIH